MAKKTEPKRQKKLQDRSPRYPSISLVEAIEKIKLLYAKEKRTHVPRKIAVTAWGYNSLHGRSLTVIASISQYGLLKREEGNIGISDDAFKILEAPRDSKERKEALERCARTPKIFGELLQKYPGDMPSDDTLMWDLKQQGFTDQGATSVIECLRETILFVKDETRDYNGGNGNDEQEENDDSETPLVPPIDKKPPKLENLSTKTWNFPLLGKIAQVSISGGEPFSEDVDLLIEYLKLFSEKLGTKKAENEQ